MRALRASSAPRIMRCTPSLASTARKIANATATQSSAISSESKDMSRTLTLERGVDRGGRRRVGRGYAGKPRHDRDRRPDRDLAHIRHRGGLGGGDRLFGLGELSVELVFENPAIALRLGLQLVAGLGRDRLGTGARFRERLLIGRHGGVGLALEAFRLARSPAMRLFRFSMIPPTRGCT